MPRSTRKLRAARHTFQVGVVLGAADYALVGVGARLFQRETVLTRWR